MYGKSLFCGILAFKMGLDILLKGSIVLTRSKTPEKQPWYVECRFGEWEF